MSDTLSGPADLAIDPEAHFLTGAQEHEYARQQMWGAYWTGTRLLLGAWAMMFGTFVFAYFYLRNLNSDNLWRVRGDYPSLIIGACVLSLILISAVSNSIASRRLRRSAAALDWIVGAGLALGLGLAAVGLQMWELARLPFQPGRSGYASLFVGWEPVMILGFLGGMYWLETLIARALRARRLLRPLEIAARDVDVTMFRGSLDAFGVFWNFLAASEVIVFLLFYVVH
jgi:heme/copper-type cytochrome/quinol oxidase subunit 3